MENIDVPRIIVLLVIVALVFLFWKELGRREGDERKKLLVKGGFMALLALVFFAVATGRAHWLAALITALLPAARWVLGQVIRNIPFLHNLYKQRQTQKNPPSARVTQLTVKEALQILGLEPGASREEIIAAHKKLIQKLHPDQGGNDYLAAQLNAARDLLLKNIA